MGLKQISAYFFRFFRFFLPISKNYDMFTLRLLIGTSGASGRDDMRLTFIPSALLCYLVKFP